MNDALILVVSVTSAVIVSMIVMRLQKPVQQRLDEHPAPLDLERLQGEVKRLQAQNQQQREEIDHLKVRLEHEVAERNRIAQQFAGVYEQMQELQKKIAELQKINATLAAQIGNPERVVVLGIWSGDNLDTVGERDAIYNAGIEYHALFGNEATRANILRELQQGGITVVEIGAHGDADAIFIHGEDLTAGWWERVLKRNPGVRVAVVLACFSDYSVADAMRRAGVQHVIAVEGELDDEAAVQFVEQFYQLYARGKPVTDAFEEARLAIDYHHAEKLVLRS